MPDSLCRCVALFAVLVTASAVHAQPGEKAAPAQPVVAGFERFHASGADPVKGGRVLLGELNCISCHAADGLWESVVVRKSAPVLDGVASRIKPGYLRKFITDPLAVKPGTAMPDMFAGLPAEQKAGEVEAIMHFLAGTGSLKQEKPQKKMIGLGRDLYQKVGCIACHGTRDATGKQDKLFATSVPLGELTGKYTVASLRQFLANPHDTRPSGRMPSLLTAKEAAEVANFLMQGATYDLAGVANLTYSYYEGSWQTLPDFDKLKPLATGLSAGFDLGLAPRINDMAMKFDGFLKIARDGNYRFHLTSDDGSKLWIDGKLVVANDGIHAPTTTSGSVKLVHGIHPFTAAVFNAGGGVELDVDIEGPGLGRQPASAFVYRTPEGNPGTKPPPATKDDGPIAVQPALAEKGRALFLSRGCANCHTQTLVKAQPEVKAPPLSKLPPKGGCVDAAASKGTPRYPLSTVQRTALAHAIQTPPDKGDLTSTEQLVARTMTVFNCYACHERNKVGGVTEQLNTYFTTTQPEMGDEGRVPPSLTGAGAKLNAEYLRQILDKGSHDRPYMHTRMPGFGNPNVGVLVAMLENADGPLLTPPIPFATPPAKVKNEARVLVGSGALACIKCHTFAGHKAEGVQGIDMTLMAQRLRRGWFHQYMLDPNKYRPGTRMPAAFPGGQTFYEKALGGTAQKQIEGIWLFLADGAKAALPPGTKKQLIPLVPVKEAIIYRNFIEGAGTRAIAVGYPEQAHLAFDANNLRLAMIWQGAFMDASRHWTDRGSGFEPPAGDNVVHFPNTVAFAVLQKPTDAWPTKSGRDMPDYHFGGYRVTSDERPTFEYTIHGVKIEDFPNAIAATTGSPGLRRTLKLTAEAVVVEGMYFRAAAAAKITPLEGGWYQIGELKMRIESATPPQIRSSGGQAELLVPVQFKDGRATIVQEFQW
jgi:mono/diheme cytochrome c family protein